MAIILNREAMTFKLLTIGLIGLFVLFGCNDRLPQKSRDDKSVVARVLGKPIYEQQIDDTNSGYNEQKLRELIRGPLLEDYVERHAENLKPTEQEIRKFVRHLAKEKAQETLPPLSEIPSAYREKYEKMAVAFISYWRAQRHLYRQYGDGRILFQQGGYEAYDATRRWLIREEKKGRFEIQDPQLRDRFYQYWEKDESAFLVSDKKTIREKFLDAGIWWWTKDGDSFNKHQGTSDFRKKARALVISVEKVKGTGTIDKKLADKILAGLDRARKKEVKTLIFELNTPGGEMSSSIRIADAIVDLGSGEEAVQTVGFVRGDTSGGGVLLALACRSIYMSPESTLGPVEPNLSSLNAPSRLLKQKIVSSIRSKFARVAEATGYPSAIAIGMVDRNLKIVEVQINGTSQFLESKDLWKLQKQSQGKKIQSDKIAVVSPKGEAITLNPKKAADVGVSSGTIDSRAALLKKLGLKSGDVVELIEEEKAQKP